MSKNWFCARPFGSKITYKEFVSYKDKRYQILTAHGNKNAWITDIADITDYPNIEILKRSLDKKNINDKLWYEQGIISYTSFFKDNIKMTYKEDKVLPNIIINGKRKSIKNWENKDILQRLKIAFK